MSSRQVKFHGANAAFVRWCDISVSCRHFCCDLWKFLICCQIFSFVLAIKMRKNRKFSEIIGWDLTFWKRNLFLCRFVNHVWNVSSELKELQLVSCGRLRRRDLMFLNQRTLCEIVHSLWMLMLCIFAEAWKFRKFRLFEPFWVCNSSLQNFMVSWAIVADSFACLSMMVWDDRTWRQMSSFLFFFWVN